MPINHFSNFPEPIVPSFQYSNIPIAERSGAKFILGNSARDRLPLEINKNDKIVIVSVDGKLAWIACRNMKMGGHPVVYSLKGDMDSWNGPIEE